jgi:hypothetical protein
MTKNYITTTVFIGRLCSNFVGRPPIHFRCVTVGLETKWAKIHNGSGHHLEKQKYIITIAFIGRLYSNFVTRTVFTQGVQHKVVNEIGQNPRQRLPPSSKHKCIITIHTYWPFVFTFYRRTVFTHENRPYNR